MGVNIDPSLGPGTLGTVIQGLKSRNDPNGKISSVRIDTSDTIRNIQLIQERILLTAAELERRAVVDMTDGDPNTAPGIGTIMDVYR